MKTNKKFNIFLQFICISEDLSSMLGVINDRSEKDDNVAIVEVVGK